MYPGDERYTESLGRALRLLGDPEGPTYLRRAAEMVSERLPSGRKFRGSVHVGNLYRLAGEQRLSLDYLEPAYEALRLGSVQQSVIDTGTQHAHLVCACLLLGRYAEAETLQGFFDFYVRRDEEPLYLLARSGRTGELEPAKEAMALLGRRIRDAERPFSAGSLTVSDWDWYELAAEATRQPVRRPSPEKIREDEAVMARVYDHLAQDFATANLELFLSRLIPWRLLPDDSGALRGADLSGRNLGGLDLGGADLRETDFTGSSLWGANLADADLRGACLQYALARQADLRGASLSEADLMDANLYGADLEGAYLKDANANGSVLTGANLDGADLDGTDLRLADLKGVRLRLARNPEKASYGSTNLSGADLRGMDLSSVRIENVDAPTRMIGADLRGADLSGSVEFVYRCVLSEADLRDVDFSGAFMGCPIMNDADLRGALFGGARETDTWSLKGANLEGVDLSGLDLRRSGLEGANLRTANLSGADLSDADFTEADLTDADLRGANLEGADLEDTLR